MPRSEIQPVPYLTKRGRRIFQEIVRHVKESGLDSEIDYIHLTMLANSIDLYEDAADRINKLRASGDPEPYGESGKPSVDFIVMRTEYEKVMKHSPKYGINPADRMKMGGMKTKKKADPNSGLE
jgi:phage terminase small subunit